MLKQFNLPVSLKFGVQVHVDVNLLDLLRVVVELRLVLHSDQDGVSAGLADGVILKLEIFFEIIALHGFLMNDDIKQIQIQIHLPDRVCSLIGKLVAPRNSVRQAGKEDLRDFCDFVQTLKSCLVS